MKKIGGFSLVEVLVSLSLFSLFILPLLKDTNFSLVTNRKYKEVEKKYKNYYAIEKQVSAMDNNFLKNHLGRYQYDYSNFGTDTLTTKILLPYDISRDFNLKIKIFEDAIYFGEEKEEFLKVEFLYEVGSRQNIVSKIVEMR